MKTLVIIPARGEDGPWIEAVRSVPKRDDVEVCLVPTDGGFYTHPEVTPDHVLPINGGYQVGAYKEAYKVLGSQFDRFLFFQDSAQIKDPEFVEKLESFCPTGGAVPWITFGLFFDDAGQELWVKEHYPEVVERPHYGVFAEIMYITKDALEKIRWPRTPDNKMLAQGNERAWAYAFEQAGIDWVPIHQGEWSNERVREDGYELFKKQFFFRP